MAQFTNTESLLPSCEMKSLLCNFEHPPSPEWQPAPPMERLSTLDHLHKQINNAWQKTQHQLWQSKRQETLLGKDRDLTNLLLSEIKVKSYVYKTGS